MPIGLLWAKVRETAIDHIGATIGSMVATAAVAGAVAAWAALKAWVVLDIPAGVVLASTMECRDLKGGWSPFDPAGGRFIVGAGAHPPNPGVTKAYAAFTIEGAPPGAGQEKSTGGEETHILTEAEMPIHKHGSELGTLPTQGVYGDGPARPDKINGSGRSAGPTTYTAPSGGGAPHSIMPPYVALYYCKKTREPA